MQYIYQTGEILLILALVGLIGVLLWLVITALSAKKAAMTNAGRLYKRPLNASKNLVATAKGIVQQETVRVKHVGASVKDAAGSVKGAAAGIETAAQSVHPEQLRETFATLQNISKVVSVAAQFAQAAGKQGPG